MQAWSLDRPRLCLVRSTSLKTLPDGRSGEAAQPWFDTSCKKAVTKRVQQQVKKNLGPIIPPVRSNAVTRRVAPIFSQAVFESVGLVPRPTLGFHPFAT